MGHRRHKPSRLPTALIETLLFPLLVAHAHASTAASGATGNAGNAIDATSSALTADPVGEMAVAGGTDLYLETTINGSDRGLAHFGYRDGGLWASMATLKRLGFVLPANTPDPARLSGLQGVQTHYDEPRQSVSIDAPLNLLHLPTTRLGSDDTAAPKATAHSPGLLLNYNLYETQATRGASSLSAFTEWRAFSAAGVFNSTQLVQSHPTDAGRSTRSVRLDTSWSLSFPSRLLTLRVGDTLTAATSWSRPTHIGGVQFGTNFALQPYLITTPLPQFLGQATLPSQVELYINGMKQYSGKVPAGPFQLDAVPGINGAGNAQMVLTNALGQVSTYAFSLYNTRQLLQQGLADWSVEAGYVREDYGLRSFAYGHDPMGSGTWRYGFTDSFTGEAHAEATKGLLNAGGGGAWLLGTAGVVSASAARSSYRGQTGSQLGFGYNWTNQYFNFAVQGLRTTGDYLDVAALHGAAPPRLSASAQAGVNTRQLGSFGLGYTQLRYQQQVSRYASAYWFKSLGRRATLNISVNQNLQQPRDRSAFLSLSISLSDSDYMSTSLQHQGNRNTLGASIVRSMPTEGGLGWRAQWQQGGDTRNGQAELDYLGRYGQVQAGLTDYGGSHAAYAGANGAVVLMGGDVFATRSIYNGFALVSTNGVPNVPVKLENNLVGTTNAHGLLLVSPLNAYQDNKLSIDPMQLPAYMRIADVNAIAAPGDRAGTLVKFAIAPVRAASVILHGADGKPLPLGSEVQLHGQHGSPALVGYDGAVYLDTLGLHNTLDATLPDGRVCHASFDYRQQGNGIPQIGPLTCTKGGVP